MYFENHDQPRSINRFGSVAYHKESAKLLALILLTLKGTPFIYQGQEIGMTNGDFSSLDEIRDTETHNIYRVGRKLWIPKRKLKKMLLASTRDHARTPMQWDSKGWEKPWLKENQNKSMINVEASLANKDSILNFYKDMIAFRKNSDVLLKGDFRLISIKNDIFIYERTFEKKTYRIIANMTAKEKVYFIKQKPLIQTYDTLDAYLKPYEAVMLEVSHEK